MSGKAQIDDADEVLSSTFRNLDADLTKSFGMRSQHVYRDQLHMGWSSTRAQTFRTQPGDHHISQHIGGRYSHIGPISKATRVSLASCDPAPTRPQPDYSLFTITKRCVESQPLTIIWRSASRHHYRTSSISTFPSIHQTNTEKTRRQVVPATDDISDDEMT